MKEFIYFDKLVWDESPTVKQLSPEMQEAYAEYCRDQCIERFLEPYRTLFKEEHFRLEECAFEWCTMPFLMDEGRDLIPEIDPMCCSPFMKIKGTKYEQMLDLHHRFVYESEWDPGYSFSISELELAEHPDETMQYYDYTLNDEESYKRVLSCYLEAAKDGDLNAWWCLCEWTNMPPLLDLPLCHQRIYHYGSQAILGGNLPIMSFMANRLRADGMHEAAFMLTYVGAMKKELFCMWNLSLYYLLGAVVSRDIAKSIELLETILDILTAESGEKKDFLMAHYDGVDPDELSYLREDVERNLRLLRSSDSPYLKYVCKEVLAIYQKSYKQANDEHLYEHDEESILRRTKELFMEGINDILPL